MIDLMILKIFFNSRWSQWPRFNLPPQFPVIQGTAVEVACSDSDAGNEGSSELT